MIRHDNFAARRHVASPSLLSNYDLPFILNNNLPKPTMSSAYQTVVARLREQMQTIPAPPAEQSDYELWTRSFVKTLVGRQFIKLFGCSLLSKAAFDRLAKGETDAAVEEMVDEAVRTIESVADDAWVPWAGRLVPNIVRRLQEAAEAKDREEKERKIREEAEARKRLVREEAERMVKEEAERIARRERRQQEKLDLFLIESITVEEFERDSEVEAERSEVVGEFVGEDALGTQTSEMEVDDLGEDEVVAENVGSKGGRKRAPSSPPKLSRKRTRASTAVGSKPIVIEKTDSSASAVTACDRCRKYNIKCTSTDVGARCANCKAKHYKCSHVPAKEGSELKTAPSGARLTRIAVGGQTKAQEKKDAAKKAKALRGVMLGMFLSPFFVV